MTRTRKVATIVTLGTFGTLVGMTGATAGGGCHGGTTEGRGTRVEMVDACFTPTTLFAQPGEAITFVNRDDFEHNVTANGWGHFDDLGGGDRFTTSFADEGVYAYACSLHPGMSGSIVIGAGDSGADVAAIADAEPMAASAVAASDDGWIAAGAVGLVIGAAAAAGIATARRRSTDV
ncbi:MAG: cupredoxin domain-containing protein [Actinomycetota bacterium]